MVQYFRVDGQLAIEERFIYRGGKTAPLCSFEIPRQPSIRVYPPLIEIYENDLFRVKFQTWFFMHYIHQVMMEVFDVS